MISLLGSELEVHDLQALARCGIPPELARQAMLRRVTSAEGAAIVGRNGGGDFSGIVFPYIWPGEHYVREYRLRRDRPEIEYRDGEPRPRGKYLSPPGRGNLLYLVPGTDPQWLGETSLPIVITEGEKKALALWVLAWHGLGDAAERPRFLPVGLPGVWNWRGTIGKAPGPDGSRRDVKGPIPDLARINWQGRKVTIAFDINVRDNPSVRSARWEVTQELHSRGAQVYWFTWPEDTPQDVNGVDDLLGSWGPGRTLDLVLKAVPYRQAAAVERGPAEPPNLLIQPFNDYGNAQRLIAANGADMRYCYAFRKWLVWDGRRWVVDDGAYSRQLAQETLLEFARQAVAANNEAAAKFAGSCLNSHRITCMLREAECRLAIKPDEMDQARHLINFRNGTINLRTGEISEHRRADFITKLVHYDYQPEADCPLFRRFLDRILPAPLIEWLQKAVGYSLTGFTSEKVVFLCHGPGNNGKTTFLTTFLRLLEEYATVLQIDTLMVRAESNNTQADLADLRGARFVITSETEEGQRLAEGKLKRITQGMGRIKAVRKYENPIEFQETHKLWIDANHLPIVRGTDNAIWNRLRPIPFSVVIPPEEIDRDLGDKLVAEAEGILAWAVAGAVRWFREGLGAPGEVQAANRNWRAAMDQIGRFIEECCVLGEFAQAKARQLYQAYRKWAQEAGEDVIREVEFGQRLSERGFAAEHTRTGNVYKGLGVRCEA